MYKQIPAKILITLIILIILGMLVLANNKSKNYFNPKSDKDTKTISLPRQILK